MAGSVTIKTERTAGKRTANTKGPSKKSTRDDDYGDADNSDDDGEGEGLENTGSSQLQPSTEAKQIQQVFVDKLLGDAKANARKVSNTLDKAVNAIFDKVETDCGTAALKVNEELDAKINQIKEALKMQNEILKRNRGEDGASKVQTDAIKAQFDEMSRLGQVYRETALVSGPNAIQQKRALSLGEHKHRRQTHVRTLSCRAATIAMRETNNKLRDEKIRADTRTFIKAHRDLFTTIERSTQAYSGGMTLINNLAI